VRAEKEKKKEKKMYRARGDVEEYCAWNKKEEGKENPKE